MLEGKTEREKSNEAAISRFSNQIRSVYLLRTQYSINVKSFGVLRANKTHIQNIKTFQPIIRVRCK